MSSSIAKHIRGNAVAYVALFFAFTGSAYALSKGEVKSKHIANNAVKSKHVKDGQIKNKDLANGAVTKQKIAASALADMVGPRGPQGSQGPQGEDGPQGPPGPATGPAGGDLTGSYPNPSISDGVVTPQKIASVPTVSARSLQSFTTTANTPTGFPFELEHWDSDNMHSTTTNSHRLVAPIDGIYAFTGQIRWSGQATGETGRSLSLSRNGAVTEVGRSDIPTTSAPVTQHISTHVALSAGDTVELVAVVSATSGSASAGHGRMAMTWIAPPVPVG